MWVEDSSLTRTQLNPKLEIEGEVRANSGSAAACAVRIKRGPMRRSALTGKAGAGTVRSMKRPCSRLLRLVAGVGFALASGYAAGAVEPSSAALAGFNSYVAKVEARLAREHTSPATFLAPGDAARLRRGETIVKELSPAGGEQLPGALLHDWRGAAFIRGATAAHFERLMKDLAAYPQRYTPQVVSARVIEQQGDHFQVLMRVRQQHVITVVMDTAYDVTFSRLNAKHGYSISRSTRIDEIASPGTRGEHALNSAANHGFLWRLNTYWSYEEQDSGLYIQIESVSLTRSIPVGLGWAVGPFVESVPRDSLEFTLQATGKALRK